MAETGATFILANTVLELIFPDMDGTACGAGKNLLAEEDPVKKPDQKMLLLFINLFDKTFEKPVWKSRCEDDYDGVITKM